MKVYVIVRLDIINGKPETLIQVSDDKERAKRYFEDMITLLKQGYYNDYGEKYSCSRGEEWFNVESHNGFESTDIYILEKELF